MSDANSASRRILLTSLLLIVSASPISLTVVYTPSSSIRRHRQARASALTCVPSACGLFVGAISLPSGAHDTLAPNAALEPHRDARAAHVLLRQCTWSCGTPASCAASIGGGSGSPAA
jgi:hypothetical protein